MSVSDSIVALWLVLFNTATFLVFGFDKWRAHRSGNRVPESMLVLLGAFGGWLGGLLAMMVFHHKTAKWTFKLKYAFALIPFTAVIGGWLYWR